MTKKAPVTPKRGKGRGRPLEGHSRATAKTTEVSMQSLYDAWEQALENQKIKEVVTPRARPVYSDDVVAQARALNSQGMSSRQIAKELGMSKSAVHNWTSNKYRNNEID